MSTDLPHRRPVSPLSPAPTPLAGSASGFAGFLPPTSNTTYTPNQFFDVCLPQCSRSAIRVVGYFIRRTLGWCDQYGRPQEEQIEISFRELAQRSGVSRDRLRVALDEAIAAKFLECVREGRPSLAGDAGQSAIYRLRWHDTPEYCKHPALFGGFFEREGNRTDIPNQYFDHILPTESLSVIKVVGSVIRSSIGFAARRGVRRQWASLSYSQIQHFTRLKSRKDLALALRTAIERRYIVRLEEGCFTPDKAEQRSAVYALCWADGWVGSPSGQVSRPENAVDTRSEIETRTAPESSPDNRSEIHTTLKTKLLNETGKGSDPASQNLKPTQEGMPSNPVPSVRAPERETLIGEAAGELVRYFYAGFHRNPTDPVSPASPRERQVAGPLAARLIDLGLEREDVARWGRRLGELALEQRNPLPSFTLALHQCGDRLLAEATAEQRRCREVALEKGRTDHRARHLPAYLGFLRREEDRLRADESEAYAAFIRRWTEESERHRNPRAPWAAAMPQEADRERDRLRALQGHFHLPGFWQWDAEHNDYPFRITP